MLNTLLVAMFALNLQTAAQSEAPAGTSAGPAPQQDGTKTGIRDQGSGAKKQDGADGDRDKDIRFVWRNHPSLRFGSALRVDFVGKVQWDARYPGDDPVDFETTELHRARVGVEGELFRHIQFSIERELTEREVETVRPSKSAWKDVYVEANYTDAAQVRVGKFKIPFGLDQLTSISNLDFVYRSLAGSYLAPGRDIGVAVHGDFFGNGVSYWGGVFKQDGENARSQRIEGGDKTGAVRVTVRPFRPIKAANLDRLEVGSAFAVSELSDASVLPNGLRARTVMSRYVFYEPVFVKGQRRRYEVDLDWFDGPFGVRAEYTEVRDARDRQGIGDQTLSDARARAWYIAGAVVVTGEDKDRPVEPRAGFPRGGGAVELVGRFERIWFDSAGGQDLPLRNPRAETIFPSGERVLTLGVNWYLNRWVKLQAQAIRERLQDAQRSPIADGSPFWSPVLRVQLGI